jgi:hypothetical protein
VRARRLHLRGGVSSSEGHFGFWVSFANHLLLTTIAPLPRRPHLRRPQRSKDGGRAGPWLLRALRKTSLRSSSQSVSASARWPSHTDMLRSLLAGVVSAAIFWAVFVFCLVSFSSDPQTPIALILSPIYAVSFGAPIGIIHASLSAILRRTAGRVVAFVTLPVAAILLLGYLWLLLAKAIESLGQ